MSFKTTYKQSSQTQMKSIIFASEIKTSEFILDYLNGKGQFYIQNKYFPISSIPADKKTSFEDVEFSDPKKNSTCYHVPSIYYNYQGTYSNRFVIGWGDPVNDNEWWIGNPYQGYDLINKKPVSIIDDWKTSKIKTINIPITRSILTNYDQELVKLSFHLNEVFSILMFASIFKIDLAKYSKCSNNTEFYKEFIDDINKILKSLKFSVLIPYLSSESIDNYNKLIYTIKDEANSGSKTVYCYAYKSEDYYYPIDTLRSLFNSCVKDRNNLPVISNLVSFNPKMNKIIDILKTPGEILKNKFSYQVYEKINTDGTKEIKLSTKLAADFTLLNPKLSITDKASSMCSQFAQGNNFVPVNSEEILMKYYHKKVTGLIFFSLSYIFGAYTVPTIGLGFKVSRFDFEEMAATNNQVNQDIMSFIQSRRKTVTVNDSIEDKEDQYEDSLNDYNGEDVIME